MHSNESYSSIYPRGLQFVQKHIIKQIRYLTALTVNARQLLSFYPFPPKKIKSLFLTCGNVNSFNLRFTFINVIILVLHYDLVFSRTGINAILLIPGIWQRTVNQSYSHSKVVQGGRGHWALFITLVLKFCNNVFLFVILTTLGPFI